MINESFDLETGTDEQPISFLDFADENIHSEEVGSDPVHPTIQWVNGSPKMKNLGVKDIAYTGGFFISEEQADEDVPPGFAPYTLNTDSGAAIKGYSAQSLQPMVVLGIRRCWNVRAASDSPIRFASGEYNGALALSVALTTIKGEKETSPRGRAHVQVVFTSNLDQPYVLTLSGTNAGHLCSGSMSKPGVLLRFKTKIVQTANAKREAAARKAKRGLPLSLVTCMFVLDGLTYERKGTEGKDLDIPLFTEVGSTTKQMITRPVWFNEPSGNGSIETIQSLFLGANVETSNQLQAMYNETKDNWTSRWSEEVLVASRVARKQTLADLVPEAVTGTVPQADGMPAGNEMSF